MSSRLRYSRFCLIISVIVFLWIVYVLNQKYRSFPRYYSINSDSFFGTPRSGIILQTASSNKINNNSDNNRHNVNFIYTNTTRQLSSSSTTQSVVAKHSSTSKNELAKPTQKQLSQADALQIEAALQRLSSTDRIDYPAVEEDALLPTAKLANSSQDNESMKEREKIFQSRRDLAEKVCNKYGQLLRRLPTDGNIIWDKNIHLGYCRNAKAGTTSWLQQMLTWSEFGPIPRINLTTEQIHDLATKTFKPLLSGESAVQIMHKNSVIFTVVRHPFVRLVSAYRDKIQNGYRMDLQNKIINNNSSLSNHTKRHPTFQEFFNYVVNTILKCNSNLINSACLKNIDVHWMPFYERCSPCYYHFDFISKMESFDQDMRYIKRYVVDHSYLRMNYKFTKEYDPIKLHSTTRGRKTSDLAKSYYNQLTQVQKRDFYNAYYFDFILFGYKPNDIFL